MGVRYRFRQAQRAVRVGLLVEDGLPTSWHRDREVLDRDLVDSAEIFAAHLFGHAVALPHPNLRDGRIEPRLLAQLAGRGFGECLAVLDDARDDVPVILDRAVEHQEIVAWADDDRGLASGPPSP